MKDLTDRFSQNEAGREVKERPDPLARLQHDPSGEPQKSSLRTWIETIARRPDIMAALFALAAVVVLLWPQFRPKAVLLPPVKESNTEIATLTVRPLTEGSTTSTPDWDGLFNAYHLETSLRDISIRCNYGLPIDARVDRYLHARLTAGVPIRIFLADPGVCPSP